LTKEPRNDDLRYCFTNNIDSRYTEQILKQRMLHKATNAVPHYRDVLASRTVLQLN